MKRLIFSLMGAALVTNAGAVFSEEQEARIGDAASAWFAMQAQGSASAPYEPMLGVEASAARARYLKTFEKEIPDRFGSTVKDSSASNGGG
jgi:hypothetical protein